jgi:hypothetical protein
MGFDLITFDAYAALVDYRSSLLPGTFSNCGALASSAPPS